MVCRMKIMKNFMVIILISITTILGQNIKKGEIVDFADYLRNFNYQERKDMKIDVEQLLTLLIEEKAELIDIRFTEEVEAWGVSFSKNIPLNELPNRLSELDKNKIIVTVCPHMDRASIARQYLTLNGFESKYLTVGLLGLVEYLRGDKAKDFVKKIKK